MVVVQFGPSIHTGRQRAIPIQHPCTSLGRGSHGLRKLMFWGYEINGNWAKNGYGTRVLICFDHCSPDISGPRDVGPKDAGCQSSNTQQSDCKRMSLTCHSLDMLVPLVQLLKWKPALCKANSFPLSSVAFFLMVLVNRSLSAASMTWQGHSYPLWLLWTLGFHSLNFHWLIMMFPACSRKPWPFCQGSYLWLSQKGQKDSSGSQGFL